MIVTIAGIGAGNRKNCTQEVLEAVRQADVLIGAERMLAAFSDVPAPRYASFSPQAVRNFLLSHRQYGHAVILVSGDTGFYSNAGSLFAVLKEHDFDIRFLCGISSVSAFCARLKLSWEDACLISLHGRKQNLIYAIARKEKVFSLLSGREDIGKLCRKLTAYGMGSVMLHLGVNLSYPDEQILHICAQEFTENPPKLKEGLWCLLAVNPFLPETEHRQYFFSRHIPNHAFLQSESPRIPITKEEIRQISIAKLKLTENAVLYDIGAGTGSVGIEASLFSPDLEVYAIEKSKAACELTEKNRLRFAADNVTVIEGSAPDVFSGLPKQTHAFIGGSSGALPEIVTALLKKNPKTRIVITALTLETIAAAANLFHTLPVCDADVTQIQASHTKKPAATI